MKQNKLKQIQRQIKKIDIFASPVELMIQKKRQHQSLFGAMMTVVMFGCIITYIVNKFVQLGRRKEFQTLYSEVYYEEVPIYPLYSDNFTLQFAFQKENQKNYIDESVYQVNAFMVNKFQSTRVDNKTIQNFTKTEIPLTKCAKIGITFEEIEEQLDNIDFSNTYCIDWNNISELSLTGTPEQQNYTYMYINFQSCVNDTSNSSESVICKSKEEIQEQLRRNYIQFQISSYNIDLRNYQQPNVPKVEEIQTTISSQVLKDITLFMQPITTLTEEGLLDELVRKDSTIRYQKSQEIIDFNSDEALATVYIRLSNTENISYRIYPKLQDILAQAGGLWELLMLAFSIIVKPFSQMSFKMEIINSLFNFEGQKQIDQEENKNKVFEKLNAGQENIQTNENDVSIMLNQMKSKTSSRFPRGRIKAKTQKADAVNSVQTEKSSQIFGNSPESDKMLQKGINSAFRRFFNVATLKLKFSLFDYLKYLKCGKKEGKYKQLNYSISKLDKCLDILFIIDKLQEIDKLKMILLSKEQVQLFEFLPKPLITLDPTNQQYGENQQYSSLLKPFKGFKEKSLEAQQVLDQLLENLDDPITHKLISLMDSNLIKLLQIQHDLKKKQTPQLLVNDFVEE
ncbi:unnamed protein product (macronuclear) [Paramecium tetraurelia]|uniref:Transmembrane protein n=1 Tax=Paramecium tetraurelia TaxID=5888 RepID=A0CVG4_PARTE|nr:uncharacterized protein GSPATT00010949001 [Paramecium tetraurelia]CAK74781.1 unnamed protein product [Paramecium tetraurelia]|eukprot:XP_001442178.1 hypothetical protein (macronuclear) [Paramecium tetraurelia strain d4-2]